MTWAVRVEGVSKRYQGGGPRYGSLRHDLARAIRGLGPWSGDATRDPKGVLALDDLSFEVKQGECFAIIGPNGAGKSTALRIISRITYPSTGIVRVRGRVGALIEVGSGVHPELTARENIWLYGQILGMSRADVRSRFEAIIAFSELESSLDIPVKMFSSGMQLRLGFAIASHLDPDVLVVDEALAVGDAGFQSKCAERMTSLVAQGRSLIFVSHNLSAIEATCQRGIFLVRGRVRSAGDTRDVLRAYLDYVDDVNQKRKGGAQRLTGRGVVIEGVSVHDLTGNERYAFLSNEGIEIRFRVAAEVKIERPSFSIGISDGRPGTLVLCSMLETDHSFDLEAGCHVVACRIDSLPLNPRTYELWMSVRDRSAAADIVDWSPVGAIRIRSKDSTEGPGGVTTPWMYGPVRVQHRWLVNQ